MSGVIIFVCSTSWISRCFPAAIFFQFEEPNTVSKRAQERRTGEEPVVAKSRPVSLFKKFEREWFSHVGFGYIPQHQELQIGLEFWSHKHWEIRARQKRKLSVRFSSVAQRWQSFSKYREMGARNESAFKYQETRTWSTEWTYRDDAHPAQSRDL